MDVLVCLAEHAGEVVSRDTLNEQVWGNVVVTDQAVTNCISELRHHLGDDRSAHRVIETIPKRGYRLTAPVQLAHVESTAGRSSSTAHVRWSAAVGSSQPGCCCSAPCCWASRVVVVAKCVNACAHQRSRAALRERGRR